MHDVSILHAFFVIFTGAAVLATLALYSRQPLITVYIFLGAAVGPHGLHWITDPGSISDMAKIGIIFLLFLLGLDLQPSNFLRTARQATLVALVSSLVFALAGYGFALAYGLSHIESLILGAAMMFSSTIIGIKLLPTTVLHHRYTGELIVGLLLLQDVIAIVVLLLIGGGHQDPHWYDYLMVLTLLPILVIGAVLFVKYLLLKVIQKFDRFQEYIFLIALGWCLGLAVLAETLGLSFEIGAFVAGISLATSPIAQFIAISLKPLRDFFLILFFFSLGASFNLNLLAEVILPAGLLAALMLVLKPLVFRGLLSGIGKQQQENKALAWDVGFRLGQVSEFSLLIAYLATAQMMIGEKASHIIQATAIITFVVSSYIVVFNYPTPIGLSDKLRRD